MRARLFDTDITIAQHTDYPWDGEIQIDLTVAEPTSFALRLRIPSFAQGKPLPSDLYHYLDDGSEAVSLQVDGEQMPLELRDGYVEISRRWSGTTSDCATFANASSPCTRPPGG